MGTSCPVDSARKIGRNQREVDLWDVLNAIFYLLSQGCTWRNDGTWVKVHDRLRAWVRVSSERAVSSSEVIVDSQSVKTAARVNQAVGYDAGKQIKGRKRFLTADTLGLVLRVFVITASVGDARAANKCFNVFSA